ncbi:ATP-dependent DNA helicase RecG [Serinibacter salmoneus]|uniref:Probable DNA 3'-5' helicase RecG n=1 Tax=Serinibacter salmoneus TaxID=556530 RepID=A0A2A9D0C4_9MICO|nr:ATP-dependent DNA helicase RecG [Serinibacter salmoneus]PFG20137.1 ATP-dependent DNA helicase RecG [Serinibacter salmoneus]
MSDLDRQLRLKYDARKAKKFEKLGITTVRDLLTHYPRRAFDPGRPTDLAEIARLPEGQEVMMAVDIASLTARPMRNRRGFLVEVTVTDGVSTLPAIYFAPHRGRVTYLEQRLVPGRRVVVEGKIKYRSGRPQVVHPTIEEVDSDFSEEELAERAKHPRLTYPQTAGVDSKSIATLIKSELDALDDADLPDPVPPAVRREHRQMDHAHAIRGMHRPESMGEYLAAQDALRYEEAFVLQAAMAKRRAEAAAEPSTPFPRRPGGLLEAFDARLPFALTEGQRAVGDTLAEELAGGVPMQRLLQGEVGSGKTVVALRAMLQVVDGGGQAALLAPTEVLAAQHERSLRALLGPLAEGGMLGSGDEATRVVLLTGSMSTAQRRAALAEAASGSAGIVVGTHALIQEHVQFADLGLVVVDEQHRFGVEQRDALRAKGRTSPHLLVMTATPIPRTVAMTIFGDLEVSTLREVPAGRAEITTHLVQAGNLAWVQRMWTRIAEEVAQGRRAYVVCPRITSTTGEAGEELLPPDPEGAGGGARGIEGAGGSTTSAPRELSAVEDVVEQLREEPALAGIPIGMLHGRMSAEEKDAAMAAFASGEVPVLVATTVIEVGVDVPQASVMAILDADRFGLSQLHQLRGRIGRGSLPGVCLAHTAVPPETPEGAVTPAWARLTVFAGTRDGFVLADEDLKQRREGDVLGANQSGRTNSLRLLRVVSHAEIIDQARADARAVIAQDPTLTDHAELAAAIERALDAEAQEYLERS